MHFFKITTTLLIIAVGTWASDSAQLNQPCSDVHDCNLKAVRHLGHVNARRAMEAAHYGTPPSESLIPQKPYR